ncbi:unnamed protein product [Laminaria digitata]
MFSGQTTIIALTTSLWLHAWRTKGYSSSHHSSSSRRMLILSCRATCGSDTNSKQLVPFGMNVFRLFLLFIRTNDTTGCTNTEYLSFLECTRGELESGPRRSRKLNDTAAAAAAEEAVTDGKTESESDEIRREKCTG